MLPFIKLKNKSILFLYAKIKKERGLLEKIKDLCEYKL